VQKFWLIRKPNVGEQQIYLAATLSDVHALMAIDLSSYVNRITTTVGDALMGSCYGISMTIMST